jgi:DNA-binding XRE family transcriptional regulator
MAGNRKQKIQNRKDLDMKIKTKENQITNHNKRETTMSIKVEKIGLKIKRIREEKGYSQDSVHPNQSTISQIESGKNANPNRETLEVIAKGLDMTIDELIAGSLWKDERPRASNGYAICPTCFNLDYKMETGITSNHLTFGKNNKKGEENSYCPECGTELITECPKCSREVEQDNQNFCQGCGHEYKYSKELVDLVFQNVDNEGIELGVMSPTVMEYAAELSSKIIESCGIDYRSLHSKVAYEPYSVIKRYHLDVYKKLTDKARNDLELLERIGKEAKVLDAKISSKIDRTSIDTDDEIKKTLFAFLFKLTAEKTRHALSSNDAEEVKTTMESIKDIMVAVANGDEASIREVVEAGEQELTSDRKDNENV